MSLSDAEVEAPMAAPALPPVVTERAEPPQVFRALIESLELDDFGPTPGNS
jgi:hypothetical protein